MFPFIRVMMFLEGRGSFILHQSRLSVWDFTWAVSVALLAGAIFRAWRLKKGQYHGNPTNWPLLGMLPALLHNLHHLYNWGTPILTNNGGSFLFHGPWLSNMRLFVTTDPRNVEHALRTRFHNYPKGKDFSDIFHDLLGNGIFNADGPLWHQQRKLTSLQIRSRLFREFTDSTVFEMVQKELLPTLRYFCEKKRQVDFQDLMLRFTFDTICVVGLGTNTGCLSPDLPVVPFAKALEDALECAFLRFFLPPRWWQALRWLRLGKERSMPRALKIVHEFSEQVISSRKRQLELREKGFSDNKSDLLSCFLKMGGDIYHDEEFLKGMAVSFLVAGRDTSALALSWFFWLLAKHPKVEEKVVEEARQLISACKEEGKPFLTRAELNRMHYLHAALTEALRLYPSVPIEIKHVMKDDVLPDGNLVKKNDKFVYTLYGMGRMESIWGSDCTSFLPERWLHPSDGTFTDKNVSAFLYPAFNAGPRTCLGKEMAYLLMKTVASTILFYFRVVLVPGHKVAPKLSTTLYMKDGLLVTLEPRNALANDLEIKF